MYTDEKPLTEGEVTSTETWSYPLSSWAYYYKLRQTEWIVQLGFELNIYQNDELSGMYWLVLKDSFESVANLTKVPKSSSRCSNSALRKDANLCQSTPQAVKAV